MVGHEKTMQGGKRVGEKSFPAQSPPPFRTHLLYDAKGRGAPCRYPWTLKREYNPHLYHGNRRGASETNPKIGAFEVLTVTIF